MSDPYRSRIVFSPSPVGVYRSVFARALSLALLRLSRGRRA
jgi:hypothetical protein